MAENQQQGGTPLTELVLEARKKFGHVGQMKVAHPLTLEEARKKFGSVGQMKVAHPLTPEEARKKFGSVGQMKVSGK